MEPIESSKKLDNIKFVFYEKYSQIKLFVISLGITFMSLHIFLLCAFYLFPINNIFKKLNSSIELIACLISIPLLLEKWWPKAIRTLKPFYWVIAIIYLLPFWAFWMFLENQEMVIWEITLLISSIILIFLIPHILLFPTILIGYFSAYLLYLNIVTLNPVITSEILAILCMEILMIAYFIFFEKKRERLMEENFDLLKTLGGSIAHELKTPIISIMYGIQGLKKNLSSLFSGYEIAAKNYLLSDNTEMLNLEILKDCHNSLERSAKQALTSIEIFLLKMKGTKIKQEPFHIMELLKTTIDEYPFIDNEKDLIFLNANHDFILNGNDILFKYIIFNLIKNALYEIKKYNRGNIIIDVEHKNELKLVRFKDTANGISEKIRNEILENFDTTKKAGTGLGLRFCKLAMEEMDGTLECHSEEGNYTEFILKF